MKILLTGATGQVGWELTRSLMPLGHVVACDRAACDLAQPDRVGRVVDAVAPEIGRASCRERV